MVIKKTSIFLLLGAAIAIVAGVVIRDVCVYISGGRPWSATVDGLCSAFLCANRDCVLVKMPVCGNSMEFEAKHLWRGKYQFRLWVPEVVPNFTTVDEKVGLECAFYDTRARFSSATALDLSAGGMLVKRASAARFAPVGG